MKFWKFWSSIFEILLLNFRVRIFKFWISGSGIRIEIWIWEKILSVGIRDSDLSLTTLGSGLRINYFGIGIPNAALLLKGPFIFMCSSWIYLIILILIILHFSALGVFSLPLFRLLINSNFIFFFDFFRIFRFGKMDLVSAASTKKELSDFLKVFKAHSKNIEPNSPEFFKLLNVGIELSLGFTGQIWFFFLKNKLNEIELPPGLKHF